MRQLENICHWLTVMAPAQVIEPKDLPPEVLGAIPEPGKVTVLVEGGTSARHHLQAAEFTPAIAAEAVHANSIIVPTASEPAALASGSTWEAGLEAEALALLATGRSDVWEVLTRRFESKLIQTALLNTRGRRIEAAQKLGIGRNTITRKIQELHLE